MGRLTSKMEPQLVQMNSYVGINITLAARIMGLYLQSRMWKMVRVEMLKCASAIVDRLRP